MAEASWDALVQDYKENSELAVLPNARYQLEVISAVARCTDMNQDVNPTYRVTAGPYAGKRVMVGVLSIKGNALAGFFKTLKNGFGLDEAYFAQFAGQATKNVLEAVARDIIGTVVEVDLIQEEPNQFHDDVRMKTPKPSQTKWVLIRKGTGGGGAAVPVVAPAAVVAAPVAEVPAAVAPPTAPVPATAPVAAPAPAAASVAEAAPPPVAEVPAVAAVAAPAVVPAPAAVEAPALTPAAVPAASAVTAPVVAAAPAPAEAAPAVAAAPAPVAAAVIVENEPSF